MSGVLPRYKNNKVENYSTINYLKQHQPQLLQPQFQIENQNHLQITNKTNLETPKKERILFSPNMLLTGHTDEVYSLAFSSDGKYLASGGKDKKLFIWQVSEKCPNLGFSQNHKKSITDIKFTFDNEKVLTCSADNTLNLIDLYTLKNIRKFRGHENIVTCCDTNNKGNDLFISGGNDCKIKLWDPREKKEIRNINCDYPIMSLVFKNNNEFFSGGLDNIIRNWDIKKNNNFFLKGHVDCITDLKLSYEKSYLLSNSMDNTLKIWDIRTNSLNFQKPVKTFKGNFHDERQNLIRSSWNFNGKFITTGGFDKKIYIWNTNSKKLVGVLGGHEGIVNSTIFHPRRNLIASCSADRCIILTELPEDVI